MIFSHGYDLIVRSDFGLDDRATVEVVRLAMVGGKEGRVLVAAPLDEDAFAGGLCCLTMYMSSPPRTHGVIHQTPSSLAELASLVNGPEFDLLETLRDELRRLPSEYRNPANVRRLLKPLIVVGLPKKRDLEGEVEWTELKGFLCCDSLEAVGVAIGAWEIADDALGQPLNVDPTRDGSTVEIGVVNVVRRLTWQQAAWANGLPERTAKRIVAIGAGAFGSQLAMNLARAGYGQWTIVDNDALMPHNLARHALVGDMAVGHNKAVCVAACMNAVADDAEIATSLSVDVLRPGEQAEQVAQRLDEADLILDMSAAIPVGRELAARSGGARCASLFLSPSGGDLVLLAEDGRRSVRLDDLEMVYYRALVSSEQLADHLKTSDGMLRYGVSCRDVSSRMAQAHVAVHAAIGSAAVQRMLCEEQACVRIWRHNGETGETSLVDVEPERFVSQMHGVWRVTVAREVLETVCTHREQRLPNETGGILIGSVDHEHRRIYVLLALPSPPDSAEWPIMYIRGVVGLRQAREEIVARTAGHLDYLGEWHSHPKGNNTDPSDADRQVFGWIREHLAGQGQPPVMLIAGEGGSARIFVETLDAPLPEPLSAEVPT